MKSITLASIVFTLSFCLNLVAGKNVPYKGSPSAGTDTYPQEVEDTEDNNGERGTYMFRTKRDLYAGGDVRGGKMNNAPGVAGVGVGGVVVGGAGGVVVDGITIGRVGVGGMGLGICDVCGGGGCGVCNGKVCCGVGGRGGACVDGVCV